MSTKQDWKQTGKDLGHAFKGLGKTLVKTVKTGVDAATDWAEENNSKAEDNVVVDVPPTDEN